MYVLVVDDELRELKDLENEILKVFPNADIHSETEPFKAMEWMEWLARGKSVLKYAFLDVHMDGMDGLELARRIKTVHPGVVLIFCTAYKEYAYDAFGLFARGYLLKPVSAENIMQVLDNMVYDWRNEESSQLRNIRIQTFGHFEVFVDNQLLTFSREKAKELLAYLVDRHGAAVTTRQIAMILWEDKPYDQSLKNAVTKIYSSLKDTLKAVGIEDILVKSWNHMAVDITKVKCDAYDYEKGDAVAINSFRGEYMANYSWAEFTAGRYDSMLQQRIKFLKEGTGE